MDALQKWNERYRSGVNTESGPSPLLVEATRDLPPGRTIDLACGAGRNSIHLAARGWEVVAVDVSDEALRILTSRNSGIESRQLDLERETLPFDDASFDLVIIFYFLHRPLFEEVNRIVRPGGRFVGAIHIVSETPDTHSFVLERGELRDIFEGWQIVHYEEGSHSEGHRLPSAEIVCIRA